MQQQRGFNLMELMVAVSVIGIIVAISLPSYNSHMLNTRRTASAACLTEMAQFMERVYTTSMSYSVDNNGQATVLPNNNCINDLAPFYSFTLNSTPQTFVVTASPVGIQTKDTNCGVLTIDQTGVRTANNSNAPVTVRQCW